MKKIILSSAFLLSSLFISAQDYCDKKTAHDFNSVTKFQNEFTVTLQVDSLILGDGRYKVSFSKSETFSDESPLLLINDSIGFKVTVAKVVLNGEKKYMYSYSFYRKKDCWKKVIPGESWNTFDPGNSILAAYSVGTKGDSDYFNFQGNISIK